MSASFIRDYWRPDEQSTKQGKYVNRRVSRNRSDQPILTPKSC